MKAGTKDAMRLMMEGSLALAEMEHTGIAVNVPYLESAIANTAKRIKDLEAEIRTDPVYETWRKKFGQKTNLGSREQLGKIVFGVLGYETKKDATATGRNKTDAAALEHIDLPFLKNLLLIEKLKKLKNTNLIGLQNEMVDGFIHPMFNLNLAVTYRSSCERPNTQNFPKRDEDLAEIVRRCLIAREGYQVVELDFKGIEVGISCCYNKDPVLIEYVKNPKMDMHRDMAAQCYMIEESEVTSKARYCAKNLFVFPQFYGDYYIACARNLWEAIGKYKLETVSGTPLKKHLRKHGIKSLGACVPSQRPEDGTFEKHLKEVEYDFWKRRFCVYDQWKKDWWEQYQTKGGFRTLTGFYVKWGKTGVLSRNEAVNNGIQGSAFHCALWTVIELQKWLRKSKMKSKLTGTIHDSVIGDIHPPELGDYLAKAKELVEIDLPKVWPWICVPLTIEAEVSPVNGSWWDKKPVKI